MLLLLALVACETRPGSPSAMFTPTVTETVTEVVAEAADPVVDEAFSGRRSQECIDDPFDCEDGGDEGTAEIEATPVADAVEAVVEAVVEVVEDTPESATTPAPEAVGLPSEPAWGVRLLQTLPAAQPPRAAIGLSSGEEIIVAPGSMISDAGLVVIAVGDQTVQLARVEAVGDHAEIETVTLHALYPR